MNKSRKSYTNEFKFNIVLEVLTGSTIEEVSKKHNLHPTQITLWKKKVKELGHTIFDVPNTKKKPERDPKELTAIIGELTIQNQILKKAYSVWD